MNLDGTKEFIEKLPDLKDGLYIFGIKFVLHVFENTKNL